MWFKIFIFPLLLIEAKLEGMLSVRSRRAANRSAGLDRHTTPSGQQDQWWPSHPGEGGGSGDILGTLRAEENFCFLQSALPGGRKGEPELSMPLVTLQFTC